MSDAVQEYCQDCVRSDIALLKGELPPSLGPFMPSGLSDELDMVSVKIGIAHRLCQVRAPDLYREDLVDALIIAAVSCREVGLSHALASTLFRICLAAIMNQGGREMVHYMLQEIMFLPGLVQCLYERRDLYAINVALQRMG